TIPTRFAPQPPPTTSWWASPQRLPLTRPRSDAFASTAASEPLPVSIWHDALKRAADHHFRTFGEPAVYTPADGEPVAVTVIRRQPAAEVEFGSVGFRGVAWEADLRACDVAAPTKGGSLTAGTDSFIVTGIRQHA